MKLKLFGLIAIAVLAATTQGVQAQEVVYKVDLKNDPTFNESFLFLLGYGYKTPIYRGVSSPTQTFSNVYKFFSPSGEHTVEGSLDSLFKVFDDADEVQDEYKIIGVDTDSCVEGPTETVCNIIVEYIGDKVAPEISLKDQQIIELSVGDDYTEYGAVVSDDVDGEIVDITANLTIDDSALNTAAAGTYFIKYNATDNTGNVAVQKVRTVIVNPVEATETPVTSEVVAPVVIQQEVTPVVAAPVIEPVAVRDATAPRLTLNGSSVVTLTVGDVYTDEGATATDNSDGVITSKVITSGDVDTAIAGSYNLTYNVTDAAGNKALPVGRVVTVMPAETIEPVAVTQDEIAPLAPPITTTTVDGDYTFVTTVPQSPTRGQLSTIEIAVTNNGGPEEIILYTFLSRIPDGALPTDEGLFTTDKFFEGQTIAVGETKKYNFLWLNDEQIGTYKFFGEIKTTDWTETLQKSEIAQIDVISSQTPQSLGQSLHRFYSQKYRGHFYTTSEVEKQNIIDNDPNWIYEGIGNKTVNTSSLSPASTEALGIKPVYRFWSDTYKHHFYTVSEQEKQLIIDNDPNWEYEAIAYYTYTSRQMDTVEVFRFYSPVFKGHFYTTSSDERDALMQNDSNWEYEGVAWYAQR